MEFELVNPSDPYTFIANDYETAALTVFCIGSQYGAHTKDGEYEVPITMFGGGSDWYKKEFQRTPEEGLQEKRGLVADALESMMFGEFEDRKRYNAALNAIDDEQKRKKFIEEWQDGCSSLNDIGTYCHELAEKIKQSMTASAT